MQRLLNELLELSRIGHIMNPPKLVPFKAIVEEALSLTHGRMEAGQVQIRVEADLPPVHGDRPRLVAVVQDLVDNAVKFMGNQPHPLIEIGAMDQGGEKVFFVRDIGIGVDAEHHERVFGLFNKLDAKTENTGLGLALVKRIVKVHGGRIWLESKGGGYGSTFFYTLASRRENGS